MKKSYTKSEIEKILQEHDFEYQRVDLPFGLETPGQDRSATLDLIFPSSLEGKTVLDVGSANGYFCFAAEARGACRVVGMEIKEKRFKHASILKDILSSNVEFIKRDAVENPPEENFDYVLVLNVIHHVKEPIRLLRSLAKITLEKLIIEFPTFSDPKYRKNTALRFPSLYNKLPLIAVNASDKMTFLFTPVAIYRILMLHDKFFKQIHFENSPLSKGRLIAICTK